MTRSLLASLATVAGLALALPSTGQAQDAAPVANGQKFDNWAVSCNAVAVNRTSCMLSQQLVRDTDRVFMAEMLALWSGTGDKEYLAARVPLGTYLAAGIALRNTGQEDVHALTWQNCNARFCEALMELTPELIEELTSGDGTVIVSYRPQISGEQRVFRFNAKGLQDGLGALKPTN